MKRCLPIFLFLALSCLLQAQGVSLGTIINTPYPESRPLLTPDGENLFFVRYGHPQNMGMQDAADVWHSRRLPNGEWSRPLNAGSPLNGPKADALVAVGLADAWLLRSHPGDQEPPEMIYRDGRVWRAGERLEVEGLTDWSQVEACFMGQQAQVLLLVMANGRSGLDLYYALPTTTASWQAPVLLGPAINTSAAEHRPLLASDGRTLYFSSNRTGGEGDYDWWVSRRGVDWNDWSEPMNLGSTINTTGADSLMSLSAEGHYAIIGRYDESSGSTDLFEVEIPEQHRPTAVTLVEGQCLTPEGNRPPVVLTYQSNVGGNTLSHEVQIGADGRYSLVVPQEEAIHIAAQSPGYVSQSFYLHGAAASEQLDVDPNNTLASARLSAAYFQRDSEIDVLRLRLESTNEEMLTFRAERSAYLKDLWDEKRQQGWTFRREEWTDPEWQALQDRYQRYLNEVLPDTIPANPNWQPRGVVDEAELQRRRDQLAELEDMKRRFRQFHEEEAAEEQAERNRQEQEAYIWLDEPEPLDKINEQANRKVTDQLLPEVIDEISGEWVNGTLSPEEQGKRQEAVESLQQDIRASLQVRGLEQTPSPTWQQGLRQDMQAHIEPVVRNRMADDIRDDIRLALQAESAMQRKQSTADILEEELRGKVREQIREEETQGVTAQAPYPDGLTPVADTDERYRELHADLLLFPMEIGQLVVLDNLVFGPNEATFSAAAYPELNRLAVLLQQHPGVVVEFRGHTNNTLSHAMAMQLSTQRARAVVDYLVGQGVERSRLSYRGLGKIAPVASGQSMDVQLRNQRIEMIILEVE